MVNTNWVLFLYIYIDLAIHSICKNTALTKSNITENNPSRATNSGFKESIIITKTSEIMEQKLNKQM